MNEIDKEIIRKSKENVYKRFKELEKQGKLDKDKILSLMLNCETIEEIIIYLLNLLKINNDIDYKEYLFKYYPIISKSNCLQFGIKKISEKEKFYNLIDEFLNINSKDYINF